MKKGIIMLILAALAILSVKGQGIKFEDSLSWEQIKTKALEEKKNIFIDFYTTWCIPCKAMDENVYPLKEVGDYFNDRYISVKVQMDSTGKDNDKVKSWRSTAKMMEKQYPISAYPTMFFVNPSGDPLMKVAGLQSAEGLIQIAGIALDTNSSYVGLYRQYLAGKRESKFILRMILTGKALGQEDQVEEIGRDYINRLSEKDIYFEDNILIMDAVTKTTKDRGFQLFFKQPKRIAQGSGKKFTSLYLKSVVGTIIYNDLIAPYLSAMKGNPDWKQIERNIKPFGEIGQEKLLGAKHSDATVKMLEKFKRSGKPVLQPILDVSRSWQEVLQKIQALKVGLGEEYLIGSTVVHYMNHINENNFDNFYSAATYYDKNYRFMLEPGGLNNWAWITFERTSDKIKLEQALKWAKLAVDLTPGQAGNMDTYANILYKLGRKDEAMKWEEKVLVIKPNDPDFTLTLERMKKNEQTWPAK